MSSLVDAVVAYVTEKTGLALSESQQQDLAAYLDRRAVASATDFLSRLRDPAEFRLLVDSLTIRETFFFRYQAQFDAFRDRLLPAFLQAAAEQNRRVRLWSAGTCTGEEGYTLALIAADAGCLDRVDILATDINESYLEAAMQGEYSKRSVANVPAPLLEKYFSARDGRFILADVIRSHVTLRYLNLAEPVYPSFLNGTTGVDMIFCRNVLIYFEKNKVREIVERLGDCLAPGGVLALGHSEMLPSDWTLAVQPIGDAFFYRQRTNPPPAPRIEMPTATVSERRTAVKVRPAPGATELLDRAAYQANHGDALEAARLCRDAIALDDTLERGHYLLGLLSLDAPAAAREHFRRAVNLEPGHLPARLHLAECAERTGNMIEALHEYRNLERLAGTKPPETVLDPDEGITYGMLALIGSSARRRLE